MVFGDTVTRNLLPKKLDQLICLNVTSSYHEYVGWKGEPDLSVNQNKIAERNLVALLLTTRF